ncbi:SKA complex subunit 2 [Stegastes partitus]|uniref:Protein FAM33A n=1 Tax=Stegastes partitus TaxID=144197 RepID=A0A9Y4N1A2_9TELE|nr:PREDICTED: spindle and kinetochore-associated protein 2 [Stegastes partitus]
METTVEKLEAMFLKSEADLDCIEKWLKLDFMNTGENGCPAEENPVVMLEKVKAIKDKHSTLCAQVKEIAAAQKQSMDSIRNNLNSAMELIQHFQQTTDVKVEALTASEKDSVALLGSAVSHNTSGVKLMFAACSLSKCFLPGILLCRRFWPAAVIDLQTMKQLKMKASDAKLKILEHLWMEKAAFNL